jgi:galactokinase
VHVVSENARVALAAAALVSGQIDEFAARLFESHRSLRDLYAVSCPELDCIVDAAGEFAAASGDRRIGARMTGGGFGGCAIVLCPAAIAADLSRFIQARFIARFDRAPATFPVRAAAGAGAIEPASLRP